MSLSRLFGRFIFGVLALPFLFAIVSESVIGQEEKYPEHPDSIVKEGVPKGDIIGPIQWTSKIYPGTVRNYHLYIPKQYTGEKPACVMIVQDGLGRAKDWKMPVVMDNLIADKSIPVTIGIFIEPGVLPAPTENAQPRFNRSFEYDAVGDRYARFLLEEILPEVSKKYSLSNDPNDRAIAGASSGAICAFNAAWERPDQFRRVFSTIGTFVGLRGANEFPVLIRKTEPKPIRVFLQDGSSDLNIYAGDWFVANQDMLSALTYSNYEVNHAWGTGGHNGKHGAAILPDVLRWLWKDYPAPVVAKPIKNGRIKILVDNEPWQLVSEGHKFTEGPTVAPNGDCYFVDVPSNQIFRAKESGEVSVFVKDAGGPSGLSFGADGKLYACQSQRACIVRYDMEGKEEVLAKDSTCNDLVVLPHGLYYTDPKNKKVWYISMDGNKKEVANGISFPNGLTCSTDQTLLHVADSDGQFTYSFQIQKDGSLLYQQEYGYLHCMDGSSKSGADGMKVDNQGNLYVATKLGVQVLDQPGRVNLIINKPQQAFLSNIAFAGAKRDWLYATCGDKVYRRKTQATGNVSWEAPVAPPKPGL